MFSLAHLCSFHNNHTDLLEKNEETSISKNENLREKIQSVLP